MSDVGYGRTRLDGGFSPCRLGSFFGGLLVVKFIFSHSKICPYDGGVCRFVSCS